MRDPLYVGIVPGVLATRLLLADGATRLLKARLPHSPHHPRTVFTFAEGLTLGPVARATFPATAAERIPCFWGLPYAITLIRSL